MSPNNNVLEKLEFLSFLGLAVSLPLHEAAKNIFLILCSVFFLYRCLFLKQTLNKSELSKYLLFFLFLSVVASLGAVYKDYEVNKLHDILRCTLIGYIFVRTSMSNQKVYLLLVTFIVSALLASIQAYVLISTGDKALFELESVGHVNHSSIYLLLIIGLMLPFFMHNLDLLKRKKNKFLFVGIALSLVIVLFDTNSRATFIGFWIVLALVVVADLLFYRRVNLLLLSFLGAYFLYCNISPPQIINKFESIAAHVEQSESKLTPRERIWYTSLYVWKKEPVFGVGFGNFKVITPAKMEELYSNDDIRPAQDVVLYNSNHAHNRYVNTLVEGGLIGLVGLLVFVLGVCNLLRRNIKYVFNKPHLSNAVFWLIGMNSLIIVMVVGLFNTTLHHEHGLLAMILIALSCGYFSKLNQAVTDLRVIK